MTPEEAAELQAEEIVRLGKKIADMESRLAAAVQALQFIAAHITSDEGDADAADEIRQAHDKMIYRATATLAILEAQGK